MDLPIGIAKDDKTPCGQILIPRYIHLPSLRLKVLGAI